jgi:VIT1/CCC1 family predicted Fe2+/Mn2+ transporter
LFLEVKIAKFFSLFIANFILFFLGYFHALYSQELRLKEGFKFVAICFLAAIICYGVGKLINLLIYA